MCFIICLLITFRENRNCRLNKITATRYVWILFIASLVMSVFAEPCMVSANSMKNGSARFIIINVLACLEVFLVKIGHPKCHFVVFRADICL